MKRYYSDEIQIQVIIALLKKHGIKRVIASPGATNVTFVGSIQNDPHFEIYSSVDERSAGYIACGLATETKEPVVLSCTGATASQNYIPALIEAYYRKLPVMIITSTQKLSRVGHNIPQVTDRSVFPNDTVKYSTTLPFIRDEEELWECEIKVNRAILELSRRSGGPVHLNLPTSFNQNYNIKQLPEFRIINRITQNDVFPELPKGNIAIFIGSHIRMSDKLNNLIDSFCEANNAVVFCDHTSAYKGKYRLLISLLASQRFLDLSEYQPNCIIHIGEISGDYFGIKLLKDQVWRVNEDGELRDTFRGLRYVFEMPEEIFFKNYTNLPKENNNDYYNKFAAKLNNLRDNIPEIPFSNIWIASQLAAHIPKNSTVQFAILNTLRSWNFFELHKSITSFSNVGGFGIEGNLSSLIGASLSNKEKLYYCFIGDLAFFYDMNVIGNRHVSNNVRIMLINNGKGVEFRNFNHTAAQFGDDADKFIAAAGHYGNKSKDLVKEYACNLGFEYLSAENKKEFNDKYKRFILPEITKQPILFEVFTNAVKESQALEIITGIDKNIKGLEKNIEVNTKLFVKNIIGNRVTEIIKKYYK